MIGNIVTEIRESLGLNKAGFAAALGVSPGAVTRWENGTRVPTTEQIGALLRVARPEQQRALLEALGIEDVEQFAVDVLASAGVQRW
jgi:transcriptional regulator with XRE-family HTH domain